MARIRVKGFTLEMSQREIRERAEDRLIELQKCSSLKDSHYTQIVFGKDLNILDNSRRWLWEELQHISPNEDSEKLRIRANKLILYVNPADLNEMIQIIVEEEAARLEKSA